MCPLFLPGLIGAPMPGAPPPMPLVCNGCLGGGCRLYGSVGSLYVFGGFGLGPRMLLRAGMPGLPPKLPPEAERSSPFWESLSTRGSSLFRRLLLCRGAEEVCELL